MAVSSMKTSRRTVAAMVDLTVIVAMLGRDRPFRADPQSRHEVVITMVGEGGGRIGLSASLAPESRHRLDAIVLFPMVLYNQKRNNANAHAFMSRTCILAHSGVKCRTPCARSNALGRQCHDGARNSRD